MFTFEVIEREEKTRVIFFGDLDIEATEMFEEELTPKVTGCKKLEIDLKEVPFVDSSGIGLLIHFILDIREKGCSVNITNVGNDVQEVFSLLQLSDILGHDVFDELK